MTGARVEQMSPGQLEAIRLQLGKTQEDLAQLLQCDFVSYRRYAAGIRPVPRYIARSMMAMAFLHQNKLLSNFEKSVSKE